MMLNKNFLWRFLLFVTWMAIIRITESAHFNVLCCRRAINVLAVCYILIIFLVLYIYYSYLSKLSFLRQNNYLMFFFLRQGVQGMKVWTEDGTVSVHIFVFDSYDHYMLLLAGLTDFNCLDALELFYLSKFTQFQLIAWNFLN